MLLFDLFLILIGVFFTLMGCYWGLLRQVIALVGLLVAVIVAGRFGGVVGGWLSSFIADQSLVMMLGFSLVLIGVSAAASLVASLLRLFVGLLFLGWLDVVLGGLSGLLQAALACAALLVVAIMLQLPISNAMLESSYLAVPLVRLGMLLALLLPAEFRQML